MLEEQSLIEELINPKTQEKAFLKLVGQYKRPLYSHIRSIVIDHADADDVLQNTFIKVFRYINGFKGDSKLFSWIYRIATNEALTFLKQKNKLRGSSNGNFQNELVNNLTADVYFDGDEIQKKLHHAVALLPEKQQLVFKMKYFQDLKYEEISEILGTSTGALKASYHLAVKKIEDFLSKN